ncbi:septal ring lytic transglycosylase RlpA family protein [Nitrosovibrio tenuis]|uniref:Endolytic peptidoglycan transglycosylase RlpA n=1 Tax=Nitrosovibrio tenuis TaxID=1233 RepID=A0A1H7LX85_9PROT|nr:septal ring lytic transglycosylase RlpA family protein [Nitrosovibrio tenuis]SEL03348.1 rare lipoprotein A [Nitrosovibrio tenuis]
MPNLSFLITPAGLRVIAMSVVVFIAGCGSTPKWNMPGKGSTAASAGSGSVTRKGGGYYLDDGPGDNPPIDLDSVPDAVPRDEPLRPANMRPYVALGKSYTPKTSHESYRERGIASWYGRRYHGQKTASGEIYDMYGMTAAHTTLPLPSYVRVTNIANGKSIVVRVNDRGPFLSDRLIDLSYTAAYKLDVLNGGSAWVEVENILPGMAPDMRVAAAPAPILMQVAVQDKEKRSAPLGAGGQNEEVKPDLFQVAYAPGDGGASVQSNSGALINADTGGIYLQLGAFSAYDNADNFLARIRAEVPSLINNLGIVAKDGMFKVHAGPYPDRAVARQAAEKIAQSLSVKPMLLVR